MVDYEAFIARYLNLKNAVTSSITVLVGYMVTCARDSPSEALSYAGLLSFFLLVYALLYFLSPLLVWLRKYIENKTGITLIHFKSEKGPTIMDDEGEVNVVKDISS